MPKARNIIIFVAIAAVFAILYFMFLRPEPADDATLVSAPSSQAVTTGASPSAGASLPGASLAANDFLTLLLNVKNIKLEDAIFSDPAFQDLRDSSITLEPDGNEGRPNPFAPLGQDIVLSPMPLPIPDADSELPTEEEEQAESPAPAPDTADNPGAEDPAAGTI